MKDEIFVQEFSPKTDGIILENNLFCQRPFTNNKPVSELDYLYSIVARQCELSINRAKEKSLIEDILCHSINKN
jgi:hypothetical protein